MGKIVSRKTIHFSARGSNYLPFLFEGVSVMVLVIPRVRADNRFQSYDLSFNPTRANSSSGPICPIMPNNLNMLKAQI